MNPQDRVPPAGRHDAALSPAGSTSVGHSRSNSTTTLNHTVPSARGRVWSLLQRLDQRPVHFAIIAILATALSFWLSTRWSAVEYFDDVFLSAYFQVRGPIPPATVAEELPHTRDIILVETEYSVPRPVQAKLLEQLRLAKVVAFDFMFVDQEAQIDEEEKSASWYSEQITEWRQDTQVLTDAVRSHGRVVLGTWPEEVKVPIPDTGRYKLQHLWEKPPAVLWNSASHRAHLEVIPGRDGVVRHVRLFENVEPGGQSPKPSLGLAVAAAALGVEPEEVRAAAVRNDVLHLGRHKVPVGPEGKMAINYVGGRNSFEYATNRIAYKRVFDFLPEDFQDKIVIVGESSFKSKEIFETPFGPMPGMQIHANIVGTLLSAQGAPLPLAGWQTAAVAFLCSLALLAPLLRWPLWTGFLAAATLCGLVLLLGAVLFIKGHRILPPTMAVIAIALTYNAVALYEYRRARETLGRFIGRDMVAPTLNLFSRLHLGGRIEEASALFCDLRGYSALSERFAAETTSRLINEYTSTLVRVVRKHGGRPIDYQGDGVFVLFERNVRGQEYSWRAIQAAVELQEAFQKLRDQWQQQAAPLDWSSIEIGIGIETGEMMIGMVGAEEHLKPGAIGDAVNVASRVQRLNRECGFPIVVTRPTYDRVRDKIDATSCGVFEVPGREAPIELFGIGQPLQQEVP